MSLKVGQKVMLLEDVRSHVGKELLIPKYTECQVMSVNNSMVCLFVKETCSFQVIRNNNSRKSKIIPYSSNLKLLKALYG